MLYVSSTCQKKFNFIHFSNVLPFFCTTVLVMQFGSFQIFLDFVSSGLENGPLQIPKFVQNLAYLQLSQRSRYLALNLSLYLITLTRKDTMYIQREMVGIYHLFSLALVCLCLAVCMSSCQIWDIWSYNINITGDRAECISKDNHPAFLHIIKTK